MIGACYETSDETGVDNRQMTESLLALMLPGDVADIDDIISYVPFE